MLRLGRLAEARATLTQLSEHERHYGEARTAEGAVFLADGDARAAIEAPRPVLETVLAGALPDQAALHGVLGQIEALGLELLGVCRKDA
jgi:hypothetical protein